MESLRPDREDLDQFKNRNKKTPKSKSENKVRASVRAEKTVREKSRMTPLFVVAFVLLSGFFAWIYIEQQEKLIVMQEELNSASDFIGRSKLLMARFEGELNVTGTEIEQSGSVVQSKLAFLDSEMRKLWVVSNERNKQAIKESADALDLMKGELKGVGQWRNKFEKAVSSEQSKLASTLSGLSLQSSVLQGESERLDDSVALLVGEVATLREAQDSSMENLNKKDVLISSLAKQLAESQQAISSINASRLQLNDRVVGMERQINSLQLKLKAKGFDVQ